MSTQALGASGEGHRRGLHSGVDFARLPFTNLDNIASHKVSFRLYNLWLSICRNI